MQGDIRLHTDLVFQCDHGLVDSFGLSVCLGLQADLVFQGAVRLQYMYVYLGGIQSQADLEQHVIIIL